MPDSVNNPNPKQIWIIQSGFVGDCVLTLPLVHECARMFGNAQITFISTRAGCEIFNLAKTQGLAEFALRLSAVEFKKRSEHRGFFKMWKWIRSLKFRQGAQVPDIVFCVQRSFRSGFLSLLSRAPQRVGFSSGAATMFYTHLVARQWESSKSEIASETRVPLSFSHFIRSSRSLSRLIR